MKQQNYAMKKDQIYLHLFCIKIRFLALKSVFFKICQKVISSTSDSCVKGGEFEPHCWQVDSAFHPSVGQ